MNRRSAGSVLASRTCIRSRLETAARTLQDGPIRLAPHPQFRTCPFLTSNQHVCSNPWAVSRVWCRGYVQGSDEHVRSSGVPISPLHLSMFVYCRTGLIYSPAQRPQIFCAPVYPPEIMVRVRMGAYVADIDALLIHHCHDS